MRFKYLKKHIVSITVCIAAASITTPAYATKDNVASLAPIIMLLLQDQQEEISVTDASRFLLQSTYGPTLDEINKLTKSSYESWIDNQLSLAATSHIEHGNQTGLFINNSGTTPRNRRVSVWNDIAMNAPDQLRQRMAFALSQIFVYSDLAGENHATVMQYYDLLVENSFTNYRELLEKVTLSSNMGHFLGMAGNQKANLELNILRPDENYAREIMQLFSIGLVELELDGTPKLDANGNEIPSYTQRDVEELAKVFTGWHQPQAQPFTFQINFTSLFSLNEPMKIFQEYHDTSSKRLLSVPGFNSIIPANQPAELDLKQTLDVLANHPNTAPFISKQLIQRFVTSNPTPGYVRRISTVFNNTDGDLGAVLKAILLDQEARQGHTKNPKTFGKIKEPILKLTGFWRGVGLLKNVPFIGPAFIRIEQLDQTPLSAPSVFNFFRPEFSPSGVLLDNGLLAPEAQLLTETTIINMGSAFTHFALNSDQSDNPNYIGSHPIATDHLEAMVPDSLTNPEDLIEHLNIVLLAGQMTNEMREVLLDLHSGADGYFPSNKLQVVNDILYLIALSPDFNIQR